MRKIFIESEINRKKNEHVTYSESYEVKYWILLHGDGGQDSFWHPKTDMYYAASKDAHKYVEIRWKKDHKKHTVKLTSITYQ